MDTLLIEGAEFGLNRLPPRDSVLFRDSRVDGLGIELLLLEMLLGAEEPKKAKVATPDSFLASLVSVSPLFSAVVPTIPVV